VCRALWDGLLDESLALGYDDRGAESEQR